MGYCSNLGFINLLGLGYAFHIGRYGRGKNLSITYTMCRVRIHAPLRGVLYKVMLMLSISLNDPLLASPDPYISKRVPQDRFCHKTAFYTTL